MDFLTRKTSYKLIGEGLNAKVYKVTQITKKYDITEVFALKVLKRKEDLNHFKKEYQNLSKAEGKRLIKFKGWKKYKSNPALVLEYIEGLSLKELSKVHKFNLKEISWIYQEIKKGLEELKESSLFHGDLSPNNIMISKEGEIKLIDFGLSSWRTQKIEVTPEFASPAVLSGKSPNLKSDLYSLDQILSSLSSYTTKNLIQVKTPPDSLKVKIKDLLKIDTLTQPLSLPLTLPPQSPQSFKKYIYHHLALLFLALPTTITNATPLQTLIEVRSLEWMSVSSDEKSWCYTPCFINVKNLGNHVVFWKSNHSRGKIKVFISSPDEILLLPKKN